MRMTAEGLWRTLKVPTEGGGDPIELTPAGRDFYPPAVSPDGNFVAQFHAEGEGKKAKFNFRVASRFS